MARRRKRRRRRKLSGWIYAFHKDVPLRRDHYKLGKTTYSVESALARAITGSSYKVTEYARYRVRNVHKAERKLHEHFADKRIKGGGREWFRLNAVDRAKIQFLLVGE